MTTLKQHESILRRLSRQSPDTIPLIKRILEWNSFTDASHNFDREAAIVSYVLLEDSLKLLILQHLGLLDRGKGEKLFESNSDRDAVLGSIHSRLLLCTELGLLTDQAEKDIKAINVIRNAFAHTGTNLAFDHPSVVSLSDFRCTLTLGEQHTVRIADNSELFTIKFSTSRARYTGFVLIFWLFCVTVSKDKKPRPFHGLFSPTNLPPVASM